MRETRLGSLVVPIRDLSGIRISRMVGGNFIEIFLPLAPPIFRQPFAANLKCSLCA